MLSKRMKRDIDRLKREHEVLSNRVQRNKGIVDRQLEEIDRFHSLIEERERSTKLKIKELEDKLESYRSKTLSKIEDLTLNNHDRVLDITQDTQVLEELELEMGHLLAKYTKYMEDVEHRHAQIQSVFGIIVGNVVRIGEGYYVVIGINDEGTEYIVEEIDKKNKIKLKNKKNIIPENNDYDILAWSWEDFIGIEPKKELKSADKVEIFTEDGLINLSEV